MAFWTAVARILFFLIPLKGVIVSAIDEGGWSRMVSRLRVILRRAFKAT